MSQHQGTSSTLPQLCGLGQQRISCQGNCFRDADFLEKNTFGVLPKGTTQMKFQLL